ncbi:MAG: DUF1828 domain-containing protein [Bacteroidetes bacterium]|nr:DUF1828 domain-containing protein [Bacteroidota bacterium]
MVEEYLDKVKEQFNNFFSLKEKRENILQVIAPLYHADGDMMDIFLTELPVKNLVRISDYGLTLMRLSYSFDVDTPNKEKILNKILAENSVQNENGNLFIDVKPEYIYNGLMQFAQAVSKITNMRLYKREIIHSLFFEMLDEFIMDKLQKYNPQKKFYPIPEHEEYEVDYCFNSRKRPIYLFGVNNSSNARLATISCQKFIAEKLSFSSLIILEDLEIIGKKDQARLMSAADKQFPSLDDFQKHAEEYIEREGQLN